MVACAMEVITLIPPVLCPDFLAILTLRCNPTIDQKPRQTSSQPSPPAIWMVRVPIHTLYMWLTPRVRRWRAGRVDDTTDAIRAVACIRFVRPRSCCSCDHDGSGGGESVTLIRRAAQKQSGESNPRPART